MKEEKPKYGWYAGHFIIIFTIIGLIGLGILTLGIFLQDILGIILLFAGSTIMIIFLWPGIGMIILNLTIGDEFIFSEKINNLNLKTPKILDIGCGTGRTIISLAKKLKNGAKIFGIDIYDTHAISGNALETVQRNAKIEGVSDKTSFQYGSATNIPFDDESIDIIIVASVLHEMHSLDGEKKALQEIYRVLKPGGFLLIGEWDRTSYQIIAYGGICCFAFKKREYWEKLLKRNNFNILDQENLGGFIIFSVEK